MLAFASTTRDVWIAGRLGRDLSAEELESTRRYGCMVFFGLASLRDCIREGGDDGSSIWFRCVANLEGWILDIQCGR